LTIAKDYAVLQYTYGGVLSALAQEKEVHCGRRNFLGMLGSDIGDSGLYAGHVGLSTHLRSPLLCCRVIAG